MTRTARGRMECIPVRSHTSATYSIRAWTAWGAQQGVPRVSITQRRRGYACGRGTRAGTRSHNSINARLTVTDYQDGMRSESCWGGAQEAEEEGADPGPRHQEEWRAQEARQRLLLSRRQAGSAHCPGAPHGLPELLRLSQWGGGKPQGVQTGPSVQSRHQVLRQPEQSAWLSELLWQAAENKSQSKVTTEREC